MLLEGKQKRRSDFVIGGASFLGHLDGAVMEDIPDPGESGVLVALVEELDLLAD